MRQKLTTVLNLNRTTPATITRRNGSIANGCVTNGQASNGCITNGFITNGYITNGHGTNGYIKLSFCAGTAVFGEQLDLPRTGGFGGHVPIAPPRAAPPDIGVPVELLQPHSAVRFDVDVAPARSVHRPSLGGPRSGAKPPRVGAPSAAASVVSDGMSESDRSRGGAAVSTVDVDATPPMRVARTVSRASDRSVASSAARRSVSATGRGGGTTTVANKQRIVNALNAVCLAGSHRNAELAACMIALEAASAHTDAFIILVTAPDSTSYRALYTLRMSSGECIKVHGAGPVELTQAMRQCMGLEDAPARGSSADAPAVTACFKYSTSQRCFQQLPSTLVGLTTDAISIRLPRRR